MDADRGAVDHLHMAVIGFAYRGHDAVPDSLGQRKRDHAPLEIAHSYPYMITLCRLGRLIHIAL